MEISGKKIVKAFQLYTKRLLWPILHLYDVTCKKEFTCAVADLMLLRDGEMYNRQFYVAARLLDAKLYYEHNDHSFPYQVAVSYNYRPKSYNRTKRTKEFISLLESVKEYGYDGTPPLTIDKDLYLINGTHRMALALYNNVHEISIKCLMRRNIVSRGFENRPLSTLPPSILENVLDEFDRIQNILQESGQTFIFWISGENIEQAQTLFSSLTPYVTYYKFFKIKDCKPFSFESVTVKDGYFAQFIPNKANYKIKKNTYYSQYVKELQKRICKKTNIPTYISLNCLFGQKFHTLCRLYAKELDQALLS